MLTISKYCGLNRVVLVDKKRSECSWKGPKKNARDQSMSTVGRWVFVLMYVGLNESSVDHASQVRFSRL